MAKKASSETKAVATEKPVEYRVLARKYRPQSFAEMRGQEALVRTLREAYMEVFPTDSIIERLAVLPAGSYVALTCSPLANLMPCLLSRVS